MTLSFYFILRSQNPHLARLKSSFDALSEEKIFCQLAYFI